MPQFALIFIEDNMVFSQVFQVSSFVEDEQDKETNTLSTTLSAAYHSEN